MKSLLKKLCLFLLFSLFCFFAAAERAPLHVEGKWIKDDTGQNITLRGVAISDIDAIYKGDRSQAVNTSVFDIIDIAASPEWNVDVIRVTVHPTVNDETGTHGWLHNSPDYFFNNILDPVVQYIIQKGMYVIVDWHYVGVSWTDQSVADNTINFWNYIAPKYANHPNILFELFNEPGQGDWYSWQQTAQGWINTIRNTHNADNLIIVGGPTWSQRIPQNSSELMSGGNLVYACHIYPMHMQWGTPNWIDYASSVAPVMMTEWGYENNGNSVVTGTTSSYGIPYKNFINSKPNVGWIAWCFDFVYRSVMFDSQWNLLGEGSSTRQTRFHDSLAGFGFYENSADDTYENYMGKFAREWLAEFPPVPRETTPPVLKGDADSNGSVDIIDAMLAARYSAGLISSGIDIDASDVNGDGNVDIIDALIIARYSAGLIPSL